jgi:hypothetical protein
MNSLLLLFNVIVTSLGVWVYCTRYRSDVQMKREESSRDLTECVPLKSDVKKDESLRPC